MRVAPPSLEAVTVAARRSLSAIDRRRLWEAHDGLCYLCDKPVEPNEFEADHVIALANGGRNTWRNFAPAHPACHKKKSGADAGIAAKIHRLIRGSQPRIVSRHNICGGEPCIEGTRVPASSIKSWREEGYSVAEIIAQYPGLTEAQVEAAIKWRGWRTLLSKPFSQTLKRSFNGKVTKRSPNDHG